MMNMEMRRAFNRDIDSNIIMKKTLIQMTYLECSLEVVYLMMGTKEGMSIEDLNNNKEDNIIITTEIITKKPKTLVSNY